MPSFKPAGVCSLVCLLTSAALVGCAHHELDTPVKSGDSTLFTSDVGPIDHENVEDDNSVKPGSTPARGSQHSSIKTPRSADYGAPTGSASGSGSNP